MSSEDFELFSITVLGGTRSGKTTLINAFVNNVCLQVTEETDDPTLYYKTLSIPALTASGSSAKSEADATVPIVAEVEDTYAFHRTDGADCYGKPRKIANFLEVEHESQAAQGEANELLAGYDMPEASRYQPLGRRRMAFMLVFDGNTEESFIQAKEAHFKLEANFRGLEEEKVPVVYMVANMSDKDPTSAEYQKNTLNGKRYAEENNIKFFEVSAKDMMKVKKLFRSVLVDIHERPSMWRHGQQGARRHVTGVVEDVDAGDYDQGLKPEGAAEAEGFAQVLKGTPEPSELRPEELMPHEQFMRDVEHHRQKIMKDAEECAVQ